MALLEGDEFVRGILEPAGLSLSDVQESQTASLRRLSAQPSTDAAPEAAREDHPDDVARCGSFLHHFSFIRSSVHLSIPDFGGNVWP